MLSVVVHQGVWAQLVITSAGPGKRIKDGRCMSRHNCFSNLLDQTRLAIASLWKTNSPDTHPRLHLVLPADNQ